MLRLFRFNIVRFSGSAPRRQNFFELNPIFPDYAQKDFDIYNVDYKHVQSGSLANNDEKRYQDVKTKLIQQVYLRPIKEKSLYTKKGDYPQDEETGFPIGMHQNFDGFIEIFKREKKVGSNVIGQFEQLTMKLMKHFGAKSQIELIRIFRFNLATLKKESLQDRLRGLLVNHAFLNFIKERKTQGKTTESLTINDIEPFFQSNSQEGKANQKIVKQQQLQDLVFKQTLANLDKKIAKIQDELQKQAIANGTFVPKYHHKYGQKITEQIRTNMSYDLNFPRGFVNQIITNEQPYSQNEAQDRYISSRINRLFFMEALRQSQGKQQISPERIMDLYELPVHIRKNDKIINSLLYKYKEYDLMTEPNMQDIYNQVDIALKKIAVKVVPNTLENWRQNKFSDTNQESEVKERIISKEAFLWNQLDVEEIFDPDYYQQDELEKVKVQQRELEQLSPSALLELSLNKMPFNLYRHADLDNFAVFNKYRKKIYQDYVKDSLINPEVQFKFFSLEEAKNKLQRIKKPSELADRYYGYAKRKSSEAEVFLMPGTGKVLINKEPLADYCGDVYHRGEALKPLIFTETAGQFDLEFTVVGGGIHSQAQCMAMALANGLVMVNPKYKAILYQFGLIGTDDRVREPKRMNLYSARVRPPYVRR